MLHLDLNDMLQALEISTDYVADVEKKLEYNAVMAGHFFRLYSETGDLRHLQIADAMEHCNDFWQCEKHGNMNVYDVMRVNLCRSRFCANCAKLIQASRLYRFTPYLNDTGREKDIYHLTFTLPNVKAAKLGTTVDIMFETFRYLIRYLKGDAKLKGIDLRPLGYVAAFRSLEITYNQHRRDFHPHLHVIMALRRGLDLPKKHKNDYSYDYYDGKRVYKRSFSDLEIFLQKLWRALIERVTAKTYPYKRGVKPLPATSPLYAVFGDKPRRRGKQNAVTAEVIHDMPLGYSCIMDIVDTHCYEAFKYAFKLTSEDDEIMDYPTFKTLYYALKGRKTIQGYGDWFRLTTDDEIDESVSEFYEVLKAYLRQVDPPEDVQLTVAEVGNSMKDGARFISRRNIQHYLNRLSESGESVTESELMQHKADLMADADGDAATQKAFRMPDLAAMYLRFSEFRRTHSDEFGPLRRIDAENAAKPVLVLSDVQLDFFGKIFL